MPADGSVTLEELNSALSGVGNGRWSWVPNLKRN